MSKHSKSRAALSLLVLGASVAGCEMAEPAKSPVQHAAAVEQTRCPGFNDDAAIADILSGKAVESVGPLYTGTSSPGKTSGPRLQGAVVRVRPRPGATAEYLDRALECHSAQQTLGRSAPSANDPFFLPGSNVEINVKSGGDGFQIEVIGADASQAREILARAQSFASSRNSAVAGSGGTEVIATMPR